MRFHEGEAANVSIHVRAHRCHPGIRLLEAAPSRVARRFGAHSMFDVRSLAAAPLRD